ncbi:MAG: phosphoribosyltransferase [Desulfovibrio sp.]|jgi:hypothetical protein|nr:phosphoribosyltransferase [Desulfovibrio sp.]
MQLTEFEKGVSASPVVKYNIVKQTDWDAAKSRDRNAAERIVNAIRTDEKTAQVGKMLDLSHKMVFITVPSTTRLNKVPNALGVKLARHFSGAFIDGAEVIRPKSTIAMKSVSKEERPFSFRHYSIVNMGKFNSLNGKDIIVVEDIFSTGSSAYQFIQTIRSYGINVRTVVGLMGNPRLDPPPQLVSKLQKMLKNVDIPIKAKELAGVLAAGEIEVIIDYINNTEERNGKDTLAGKLQWLLNERALANVEGHSV